MEKEKERSELVNEYKHISSIEKLSLIDKESAEKISSL